MPSWINFYETLMKLTQLLEVYRQMTLQHQKRQMSSCSVISRICRLLTLTAVQAWTGSLSVSTAFRICFNERCYAHGSLNYQIGDTQYQIQWRGHGVGVGG